MPALSERGCETVKARGDGGGTTGTSSAALTVGDGGFEFADAQPLVVDPKNLGIAYDIQADGPDPATALNQRRGHFLSHVLGAGAMVIATVNSDRIDVIHHTYRGATFDMPVRVVDVEINEVLRRGNDDQSDEFHAQLELSYIDDEAAPHLTVGEQYLLNLEWERRVQRWRPSASIGITAARKILEGNVASLNWTVDEVRNQVGGPEVSP
jgi:hypothetical protein